MKKGIAIKGNESTEVNILCATTRGGVGISPVQRAKIDARPKETPIGIFIKSSRINIPNNTKANVITSYQDFCGKKVACINLTPIRNIPNGTARYAIHIGIKSAGDVCCILI
jgi:hypothetical protein